MQLLGLNIPKAGKQWSSVQPLQNQLTNLSIKLQQWLR